MPLLTLPLLFLFAIVSSITHAAELTLNSVQVAPNVYAVIGDIGPQTYANHGVNSNLGFVVSSDGVLVINSGPSSAVAKALHSAIQKITKQPVKWVFNVNSQSHYWLGNAYFKALNIPILANQEADKLMQEMGAAQLQNTKNLLKDQAELTTLAYPDKLLHDKHTLRMGDTLIEMRSYGSAHTKGDMVVWLPQHKVLFSGDIVFTQRMLGVLPVGNSSNWIKAFDQAMGLHPGVIVPGHGQPTNIQTATRDTRNYLAYLRDEVKKTLDKNGSLQDAVDKIDQSKFKYLANYDLLAKRNLSQVYTEMEQESFQ